MCFLQTANSTTNHLPTGSEAGSVTNMPTVLEEDIPDMSMQSTASSATNSSAEGKGVGVSNVEETNGGDDVSHLGHSQHDDRHDLQPSLSQESNDEEMTAADDASSAYIVKELKELYKGHVVDAEKNYHLHFNFCLPTDGEIKDSEFDATPMVLLIGQYSTGKVSVYLICRIFVHIVCMFLCAYLMSYGKSKLTLT